MRDELNHSIDIGLLEKWIFATPACSPVRDWRVDNLDLWPLINTAVVSLATLHRLRYATRLGRLKRLLWQAGVITDFGAVSKLRHTLRAERATCLPGDDLSGAVVCAGSKIHGRLLGDSFVVAPLDVPSILMTRDGNRCVYWFEDMLENDPRLQTSLSGTARGMQPLLDASRNKAWRRDMVADLLVLSGFKTWATETARILKLSPSFFFVWVARQVCLALAARQCYRACFERCGKPKLIFLLNGGFHSTVGLSAAAHEAGIPVIEIQHGALADSTILAAHSGVHFSSFNSAPDALISWDVDERPDAKVLSTGPIALQLPGTVLRRHATDTSQLKILAGSLSAQTNVLAQHAFQFTHEVIVSLQPGDTGKWVEQVAELVGADVLFWVRRHGADLANLQQNALSNTHKCLEFHLASSTSLALLLHRCNVHLTRFSAVTLEAAACGVTTIAVDAYARELYGNSVARPLLAIETDLTAAAQAIRVQLQKPPKAAMGPADTAGLIVPFVERIVADKRAC